MQIEQIQTVSQKKSKDSTQNWRKSNFDCIQANGETILGFPHAKQVNRITQSPSEDEQAKNRSSLRQCQIIALLINAISKQTVTNGKNVNNYTIIGTILTKIVDFQNARIIAYATKYGVMKPNTSGKRYCQILLYKLSSLNSY